jgi:hypothetical protein
MLSPVETRAPVVDGAKAEAEATRAERVISLNYKNVNKKWRELVCERKCQV